MTESQAAQSTGRVLH